ncbi:hypothetical protein V8E53_004183 [Lactarius tabidus]
MVCGMTRMTTQIVSRLFLGFAFYTLFSANTRVKEPDMVYTTQETKQETGRCATITGFESCSSLFICTLQLNWDIIFAANDWK